MVTTSNSDRLILLPDLLSPDPCTQHIPISIQNHQVSTCPCTKCTSLVRYAKTAIAKIKKIDLKKGRGNLPSGVIGCALDGLAKGASGEPRKVSYTSIQRYDTAFISIRVLKLV